MRMQTTFAALKYPNYRLWFFGQMVSLFGTWMQSTAQGSWSISLHIRPNTWGSLPSLPGCQPGC